MKNVHPSTKKAIIREYEKQQIISVKKDGGLLLCMTLDKLRALNIVHTGESKLEIVLIDLPADWKEAE